MILDANGKRLYFDPADELQTLLVAAKAAELRSDLEAAMLPDMGRERVSAFRRGFGIPDTNLHRGLAALVANGLK